MIITSIPLFIFILIVYGIFNLIFMALFEALLNSHLHKHYPTSTYATDEFNRLLLAVCLASIWPITVSLLILLWLGSLVVRVVKIPTKKKKPIILRPTKNLTTNLTSNRNVRVISYKHGQKEN